MDPRISLIVPAFNEASYLPRLIGSAHAARDRYDQGSRAVEVIVVDNGSTDGTAQLAADRGCRVVGESKRIIAAVRNAGARAARGDVLAFTDADGAIHPETFNAIDRELQCGKTVAGATGVTLDRWSLGIALTYAVMVPLTWVTRMDTGVVFCRRDDYREVGGYDERMTFAEDVRFLLDLRRLGRRRGQRLARITHVKAIASTRKFDEHGEWHYLAMIARFGLWALFRPHRCREFACTYWYGNQREGRSGDTPVPARSRTHPRPISPA